MDDKKKDGSKSCFCLSNSLMIFGTCGMCGGVFHKIGHPVELILLAVAVLILWVASNTLKNHMR